MNTEYTYKFLKYIALGIIAYFALRLFHGDQVKTTDTLLVSLILVVGLAIFNNLTKVMKGGNNGSHDSVKCTPPSGLEGFDVTSVTTAVSDAVSSVSSGTNNVVSDTVSTGSSSSASSTDCQCASGTGTGTTGASGSGSGSGTTASGSGSGSGNGTSASGTGSGSGSGSGSGTTTGTGSGSGATASDSSASSDDSSLASGSSSSGTVTSVDDDSLFSSTTSENEEHQTVAVGDDDQVVSSSYTQPTGSSGTASGTVTTTAYSGNSSDSSSSGSMSEEEVVQNLVSTASTAPDEIAIKTGDTTNVYVSYNGGKIYIKNPTSEELVDASQINAEAVNSEGIERGTMRSESGTLNDESAYYDFNRLPPSDGLNDEYGYTFLRSTQWYPNPPAAPVCVAEKKCPVCPLYTTGTPVDLKEWDSTRRVTAPDNINTEFTRDKLNSGR